ncbi:hypothetical protein [Natronobeatus ordinarius]|uniref:hypothetical protein n=1 Tax=Natronobeatus ordinarius TaxID=2963433 RepID=UPI0020CD1DE1|nr:hypothetical protein [Natronobeatus ordinarius]
MTEKLHDRVTELLEAADRGVDSLPPLEETSEGDGYDALEAADGIPEAAEDARALLSTTDSRELLEALGLAELPDGSESGTIPEAIAGGDPEHVADLRVLLKLARVAEADHDGQDLEAALESLRDVVESRDEAADRGDGDRTGADAETAEDADERAEDEAAGDETDAETDVESEDESADESDDDGLESELRSTVGDALEGFGDDVRDVRDRLEAATADEGEGEDEGAVGEEEETAGEDEDAGDETDESADEDDESMLDAFDSGDTASGPPTMYSTMAPPPSERADMRRRTGYSTMPDR